MQRVCAILLLAVFSVVLNAAAWAGFGSNVPACCRKGGAHHCAMHATADASGVTLSARCRYSKGALSPGFWDSAISCRVSSGGPDLPVAIDRVADARAGYRISQARSRLERGPPFYLFS